MRHLIVTEKEYVVHVDRLLWDDKKGNQPEDMPTNTAGEIKDIRFTYTQTKQCFSRAECISTLHDMTEKDVQSGLQDIRYNFLISTSGTVYEGRGWNYLPSPHHQLGSVRPRTIDVAYIGDFENDDVPLNMYIAGLNLIKYGIKNDIIVQFNSISYYKPPTPEGVHYKTFDMLSYEGSEDIPPASS